MCQALKDKHKDDELIVLAVRRNGGSFTYDGIEIGAERVAKEIEDTLEELGRDGYKITKFSIVGYSLGGLVARYTIGLLYHKGYFEKITPVNFTTFATPHLGVRTPLLGYSNHIWNVLGARTLSMSGRQLFTVDEFRDTGRPLLSVLADPDSIFIRALKLFRNRSLYTNIVNDRSAVYYTTGISRYDPYVNLDKVKLNYLEGYEPVILDPDHACDRIQQPDLPSFYARMTSSGQTLVRRTPIYLALMVLLPIATFAFLLNSGIQTFRSRRRILLHEADHEGHGFGVYRIPLLMQDVRAGIEDAFENVNSAQAQDYLPDGSEELSQTDTISSQNDESLQRISSEKPETESMQKILTSNERSLEFPTLALTSAQFSMIKALDDVGFRKYPVYIHKSSHSHAAIIVRRKGSAFDEGKIVVKHWLDFEFDI